MVLIVLFSFAASLSKVNSAFSSFSIFPDCNCIADELRYKESIKASNNLRSKVDNLISSSDSSNEAIKEFLTTPEPSDESAFLT